MKISLKKLRESFGWLKILSRKQMGDITAVESTATECNEHCVMPTFARSNDACSVAPNLFHTEKSHD